MRQCSVLLDMILGSPRSWRADDNPQSLVVHAVAEPDLPAASVNVGEGEWNDDRASRAAARTGWAPLRMFDELGQDARFAVRGLRRSPGFAALAILVLALAIAANTAIFALVDVLMLRPLGLREPDRLVRVFNKNTAETDAFRSFSYPNYLDLREGTDAFEDLGAFTVTLVGLDRGDGTTRREFAQIVTSSYFSTLGAVPALGRVFTPEEEKPNAGIRSVVISHAFWDARSGADPDPIGKPLEINGEEYTIVGVTPRRLRRRLRSPHHRSLAAARRLRDVGRSVHGRLERRPRRARSPRAVS